MNLNVARVTLVRVDSTVSSVSPSSGLGGLVDADVLDEELFGVESLGVSVRLGVLEEREDELDRLDGPSTWTMIGTDCSRSVTASLQRLGRLPL